MSAWLKPVGAGLLLGAGWGVLARVYMRLVSTDPSFSWGGTLFIIGVSAWFGLGIGVVHAARRRGARRWWRLAVLPTMLVFAGPGMPLLPAATLGGWAASGRGPWPLRVVAAVVVAAVPVAMFWALVPDSERALLSMPVAVGGFWVLSGLLALAGSLVFRRWSPVTAAQPRREVVVA